MITQDRPQDVGRKHRRQRRLSAQDTSILAEYQAAMRAAHGPRPPSQSWIATGMS